MRPFAYQRASSVAEAVGASGSFLAGGTTLIDLVKLDVLRPEQVIDINRLPLDHLEQRPDGSWMIGANVRNSTLAWHPQLQRDYPVLAQAILSGASGQIRNMATTAGNLRQRTRCPYYRDTHSACNRRDPGTGCAAMNGYNRMHAILGGSAHCIATHPSDLCVALAALGAAVVIRSANGHRELPFREFHRLPGEHPEQEHAIEEGELITAVLLPPLAPGTRSGYLKVRDRESYEFALASTAVVLRLVNGRIEDPRIALGGVGTVPWRAREAEQILQGAKPEPDVFSRAAEAALQAAQPREHNAFKVPLARQTLVRALFTITSSP